MGQKNASHCILSAGAIVSPLFAGRPDVLSTCAQEEKFLAGRIWTRDGSSCALGDSRAGGQAVAYQ